MLSNCFSFIFLKTQSLWDSLTPCLHITFCCFLSSLFGWQTARVNKWKTYNEKQKAWHWLVSKNVKAKMWLNPLNLIQVFFVVVVDGLFLHYVHKSWARKDKQCCLNALIFYLQKRKLAPFSILLKLLFILCNCNLTTNFLLLESVGIQNVE